jgi:L-ribulose-5-phosphate 3-epimerase
VILDPANLVDPSRFWERERILGESLSLLGERIGALHAKDFVVEGGNKVMVSPGSGIFDYRPFLKKLLSAKPELPVILEDQRPENVAGAAEYLRAGILE